MIPNSASKLLGSLGSTNSGLLVKTIQGALTGAQVRSESLLCSLPTKKKVCQPGTQNGAHGVFDVGQKRNDSSCFAGSSETMCSTNSKFGCGNMPPPSSSTQRKKTGLTTEYCGFGQPKEKECPPELCIQKCCPLKCRILDPCCPDKCAHIQCDKEPEIKCCNKRECCPHEDYGRNQCCKEVAPPRPHRCDAADSCSDPCCSRTPICPKKGKPVDCDEFLGDALERPCPPDPCDAKGSACQFAAAEDDCCEMKLKKDACDMKGCTRKHRCVKKRKQNGNQICLNLDPNWPPKRPHCHGEPQKDPCTQCQRDCKPKQKFDDGLC